MRSTDREHGNSTANKWIIFIHCLVSSFWQLCPDNMSHYVIVSDCQMWGNRRRCIANTDWVWVVAFHRIVCPKGRGWRVGAEHDKPFVHGTQKQAAPLRDTMWRLLAHSAGGFCNHHKLLITSPLSKSLFGCGNTRLPMESYLLSIYQLYIFQCCFIFLAMV